MTYTHSATLGPLYAYADDGSVTAVVPVEPDGNGDWRLVASTPGLKNDVIWYWEKETV